ncbi:uncharacterized protein LOC129312453 [Prosopis cineraria]|uniref:uncharacterized protein LOC129312453 n=1 Tax=Prosopis cineraria TaxID=364024 RepID=UPI00240FC6AB|nr:uncharacterized protein LOC129312453 [Prosopis cineraria]
MQSTISELLRKLPLARFARSKYSYAYVASVYERVWSLRCFRDYKFAFPRDICASASCLTQSTPYVSLFCLRKGLLILLSLAKTEPPLQREKEREGSALSNLGFQIIIAQFLTHRNPNLGSGLSNLVGRTFNPGELNFMSELDAQIPTAFDPFAEANADDSGAGAKEYVHIRIQQRNGRKSLTTVQGLKKEFSYNKILKDLKKEFCCNGTVVQDPELGQVIQLQGDQRKNVSTFLVQAGIVKKEHIKIHGF